MSETGPTPYERDPYSPPPECSSAVHLPAALDLHSHHFTLSLLLFLYIYIHIIKQPIVRHVKTVVPGLFQIFSSSWGGKWWCHQKKKKS